MTDNEEVKIEENKDKQNHTGRILMTKIKGRKRKKYRRERGRSKGRKMDTNNKGETRGKGEEWR